MFHFIINAKNYPEVSGDNALKLADAVRKASRFYDNAKFEVKIYLAPPAFCLTQVSKNYSDIELLTQHLDLKGPGSTTGYLVPEIAKLSGASGSILNHSEHRISEREIAESVLKLKEIRMKSIVCARDADEVERFTKFNPDFVAVEPPELIGSGKAISKARPELIVDSVRSLEKSAAKTQADTVLLCGAGIIEKQDVTKAVELGAKGILVASGVVKAANWTDAIRSLADGFQ